jgi:aromatic ring hydroxylase
MTKVARTLLARHVTGDTEGIVVHGAHTLVVDTALTRHLVVGDVGNTVANDLLG